MNLPEHWPRSGWRPCSRLFSRTKPRSSGMKRRPIPLRATLFRAAEVSVFEERDPALWWGDHFKGGLDIHDVPGAHLTIMNEPQVSALALALGLCLAEASQLTAACRLPALIHVWRFDLDAETLPDNPFCRTNYPQTNALVPPAFILRAMPVDGRAGRSPAAPDSRQLTSAPIRAALEFSAGSFGKPFLPNSLPPIQRLALRCGGCCWPLPGIRKSGLMSSACGADFVPEELAGQVCSPREQAALCRVPPAERHAAFLSHWTAKEAYVKALGTGLSFPLHQVTLSPMAGTDCYTAEDAAQAGAVTGISVRRLPRIPGFAASLAAAGAITLISLLCPHKSALSSRRLTPKLILIKLWTAFSRRPLPIGSCGSSMTARPTARRRSPGGMRRTTPVSASYPSPIPACPPPGTSARLEPMPR